VKKQALLCRNSKFSLENLEYFNFQALKATNFQKVQTRYRVQHSKLSKQTIFRLFKPTFFNNFFTAPKAFLSEKAGVTLSKF
jgi:hypothetical protein